MTQTQINWDALRHTEGELPWDAIEATITAVAAEPALWQELAKACHEALNDEKVRHFLPLYLPVILGLAGEKLSNDESQSIRDQIADFLLDELVTARQRDDDLTGDDIRFAAGRIGPSILPKVLQRLDAIAPDKIDADPPEHTLWTLLPLAAKSPDAAIQEQVAQRCMATLEYLLRNDSDLFHAYNAMDTLAVMRWTPAAELMERLGREKESQLEDAWLWNDYEECNKRIHGIEPQEDFPEWWEHEPRQYLEGRLELWKKCYSNNDMVDEPDTPYIPDPVYNDEPAEEPYIREDPKIGRNDPCPCRSGKKYKKCCGK